MGLVALLLTALPAIASAWYRPSLNTYVGSRESTDGSVPILPGGTTTFVVTVPSTATNVNPVNFGTLFGKNLPTGWTSAIATSTADNKRRYSITVTSPATAPLGVTTYQVKAGTFNKPNEPQGQRLSLKSFPSALTVGFRPTLAVKQSGFTKLPSSNTYTVSRSAPVDFTLTLPTVVSNSFNLYGIQPPYNQTGFTTNNAAISVTGPVAADTTTFTWVTYRLNFNLKGTYAFSVNPSTLNPAGKTNSALETASVGVTVNFKVV